jgi:hypothetical protein
MLARIVSGPDSDPDKKHPSILITPFFQDKSNNDAISIVFIPCRSIEGRGRYNKTCVLPGSKDPSKRVHPYILEDSWVDFRRAKIVTLEELLTKGWNPSAQLLPETKIEEVRRGILNDIKFPKDILEVFLFAPLAVITDIELQKEVARIDEKLSKMPERQIRFPTMQKAFEDAGINTNGG